MTHPVCTHKWGNFCDSRGPPTVRLMQILHNTGFLKSQNLFNAGTLYISKSNHNIQNILFVLGLYEYLE